MLKPDGPLIACDGCGEMVLREDARDHFWARHAQDERPVKDDDADEPVLDQ